MHFDADQFHELSGGHSQVYRKYDDLMHRCVSRAYRNDNAREAAIHGFCRRLKTMVRCIDRVFDILPPEREDTPDNDEVIDAAICLQAFIVNTFGCCDNLAWMWVHEKAVTRACGKPLRQVRVGLFSQCTEILETFSPALTKYLSSRKDWFKYVKDFRDSLAHRIPLYIPPYMVATPRIDEWRRLEAAGSEACHRGDFARYDELMAEQQRLGTFYPLMTHSINESSNSVLFHGQLLTDFNTIIEIGCNVLDEFDR